MKRLLRGVIDFGGLTAGGMEINFQRLTDAKIEWTQPADEKIFKIVSDFYESELAIPSGKFVREVLTEQDEREVIERLKDVEDAPSHEGANYNNVLKRTQLASTTAKVDKLLDEGKEILGKGLVVKEGRKEIKLQGPEDAARYCDLYSVLPQVTRPVLLTEMREATVEAWADYQAAKANPASAFGVFSGFEAIDNVCNGIKPGELWVHMASTGEMKSTLARGVAYNAMTRYRHNVVYVSLEAKLKIFRDAVHVIHSAHPRWQLEGKLPLPYSDVRDGTLSPEDEEQYRRVLDDFRDNNEEYARLEAITVPQGKLSMAVLRRELEKIGKRTEIGLLVIDHSELLEPRDKYADHGTQMNSIYDDIRDLSLQWNGGKGLPVLALHQVNREGRDRAERDGGHYTSLKAVSWASEAARSASLFTWSYLDDNLRASSQLRVGCMKNRDNPKFETMLLDIHWGQKRLSSPDGTMRGRAHEMTDEEFGEMLAVV